MSLNTTCWPGPPKGLLHKSQLSIYILLGVFGKPFFLQVFFGARGSRIQDFYLDHGGAACGVASHHWSYPGPPSEIRGVVAGAPYSGKPMVNMRKTLIHSDTVKRRFGLS